MTDWFTTKLGVLQGDNLSPTLFSIFKNDLAQQMKQLDLGISIGDGRKLAILLYANDLAIISENPIVCKNCINEWCDRVKRKIYMIKTNLMEIRKSEKKGV